jgi:hypothetical protein
VERDDRVGRQVLVPERPGTANHRVAQPGDFVLESAQLHVLIGGPGRRPLERGTVLDLRRAAHHVIHSVIAMKPRNIASAGDISGSSI